MLDKRIEPKFSEEKIVVTFDFSTELATGESLSGAIAATVEVVKGVDSNPSSLLNGAAQFTASSKAVLQGIQGGVVGNEYRIKIISPTTNTNKVLGRSAIIAIE